jgi:quercetin dioxygenase-like cupin family protein
MRIGAQVAVGLTLVLLGNASAQEVSEQRLRLDEFKWPQSQANQSGSAMIQGQQVIFVVGDGKSKGLFSIVFKVPPNTKVQPHSHPEERSCFVLSGTWYFGYGTEWNEAQLKTLPVGSNYTEPAGRPHFAATKDGEVIQQCTAIGPTGTTFVNPADDPRNKPK